jgi:hypothetical protein
MKKIIGLLFLVTLTGCAAQPTTNTNTQPPIVINTNQATSTQATSTPPTEPVATKGSVTTRLNQAGTAAGVIITPLEVVEESRCPVDVMCIQAGTVRLRAKVVTAGGESTQIFTLTTPLVIDEKTITLTEVAPATHSQRPITPSDYQFTFSVSTNK